VKWLPFTCFSEPMTCHGFGGILLLTPSLVPLSSLKIDYSRGLIVFNLNTLREIVEAALCICQFALSVGH